jgi:chromosome segregation ATPase
VLLAALSAPDSVVQVGALQERVAKYESEMGAQAMALSTLTSQREEALRGNTDAVERAQLLAAEVVALEEKCLALTSDRLKAKHELDRMAEELHRATRTAQQVRRRRPQHERSSGRGWLVRGRRAAKRRELTGAVESTVL